jgi:DNA topoisomerase-1
MATYKMTLDFKGKDSVPFHQEYEIPQEVYNLLQKIQNGKKDSDLMFSVSSGDVGNFMKKACDVASPKLFRTAYGCRLLIEELQAQKADGRLAKAKTPAQKLALYDDACLVVTKKLNHQRNIAKNFDTQMGKLDENIQKAEAREKEVLKKATEQLKKLQKKIKAAKAALSGEKLETTLLSYKEQKNKIETRVQKAQERIDNLKIKKDFKGRTANYSISTARTNYSSPKIAFSWCKDNNVPIEKIYSKSLLAKFEWALNTPANYWRNFPNVKE